MPIKPSLIFAWTGRTRGHCWCLTQCSVGFCMCVACPYTSAERHILKADLKKMGCTADTQSLLASAERVPSNRVFGSCDSEADDFLGAARLPHEKTVEW